MRNFIVFELFQKRKMNLGLFGDRRERDPLTFALAPQSGAETLRHAIPTRCGGTLLHSNHTIATTDAPFGG